MEDDEQVREVAKRILAAAGYTVIATRSAAEAPVLAREHAAAIDLLLTDVVMPGTNGRGVADLVRAARPAIKVLFMSGYTDDVILQHRVLESDAEFIQKPLTSELLTRKVRSVLDAGPPAN